MNEESLFDAALDRPTPAERQAFLDEACRGDLALRRRVELLLDADEHATGLLDSTVLSPPLFDALRPIAPLAADQAFAGRFTLREKLGEGGMGEVWAADQHQPVRRRVALKLIRPGLASATFLARFEAERQALALMSHPNIAKVLEAGVEGGRPYFVMELIDGVPITRFCDEARLTIRERLELFVPVCQAVQHAHTKGVIHRDLKPSNILVESHDGRPVPKVIDFGLAKATGPRLTEQGASTEVGTLVGTPEYMSPEQADLNNLDIDTRSDIYTLGAVLYELLAGSAPHPRQDLHAVEFFEMLRIIREVEPPRPGARLAPHQAARVKGELDWIVMKCLEKDRTRRYETANGLARDLERYLADEPVQARPPDVRYRLGKFARRHRRALTAALAFVLLLVGAVATLATALVAVDKERREKESALEAEAKRRQQAREALDAMFSHIVEDWLGKQPAHLPEHKVFLQLTLRHYEEFAADTGAREEARAGVAEAHWRIGYIREGLGQHPDAEAAWDRAREWYGDLAADFPHAPAHRHGLARTHRRLGSLYHFTGRPAEAEAALNRGLSLHQELSAEFPDAATYAYEVAVDYRNLAVLLKNLGRPHDSEKAYGQALTTLKRLADQYPAEPAYQNQLAETNRNLGILLRRTDRAREAEEVYGQALAIHRRLAGDYPGATDHQNETAGAMLNLARMLLARKDLAGARRLLEEALPYHQSALKANPRHPGFRNFYRLNRWRMTETLLELKDHAAASETARQFLETEVDPPRDAYTAACLLAECARVAEKEEGLAEGKRKELSTGYGDRAVAALRVAVAKGAKEMAKARKDGRLDPLRAREDFQKLLAEWEAK